MIRRTLETRLQRLEARLPLGDLVVLGKPYEMSVEDALERLGVTPSEHDRVLVVPIWRGDPEPKLHGRWRGARRL